MKAKVMSPPETDTWQKACPSGAGLVRTRGLTPQRGRTPPHQIRDTIVRGTGPWAGATRGGEETGWVAGSLPVIWD